MTIPVMGKRSRGFHCRDFLDRNPTAKPCKGMEEGEGETELGRVIRFGGHASQMGAVCPKWGAVRPKFCFGRRIFGHREPSPSLFGRLPNLGGYLIWETPRRLFGASHTTGLFCLCVKSMS